MRLFHRQDEAATGGKAIPQPSATDVVERHPGLALVVASTGTVLAASEALRPMVAGGPSGPWWDLLYGWLSRGGDDAGAVKTLPMDTVGGPSIVEWTAVALPDNTVALFGRDVTLDNNLRAALTESRQRFRDLVDIASDFAWETGPNGHFIYVSPEGALGYAAEALVGQDPSRLLKEGNTVIRSPFEARRPVDLAELWLRRADGGDACVVAWARPLFDESGKWRGTRGLCREVTETRRRDADLARARTREQLLAHIVRAMRDEVEPDRMLTIAAGAIANAIGAAGCRLYRQDENGDLIAVVEHLQPAGVALPEFDAAAILGRTRDADTAWTIGAERTMALAVGARSRNDVNGAVMVWRAAEDGDWDEDDRRLIEAVGDQMGVAYLHIAYLERLRDQAERDGLTRLLNRRTLIDRLSARFGQGRGADGVLLYIDIDNFKAVNDAHGHQRGDAILTEVTAILRQTTGTGDLVGRIGGDEFAVWLDGADRRRGEEVAKAMVARGRALAAHSAAPDRPTGLSVGIAVRRAGSGEAVESAIERADQAMYRAKAAARRDNAGGGWAHATEVADR